MYHFNKKTFKNGLRIITAPIKDSGIVTILVLVGVGSKYENKKVNGISHFLEHMCFKGTISRPSALDIASELDSLGSQYNAFTSQEFTGYYVKSDSRHFKKIFDVISDIYLNSTFPESEIKKEKGVILEERNMYRDLPNKHVQDLIMKLLYGHQPAGRTIVGERETIIKMTRNDFLSYKKEHYVPSATIVIVAGQIEEKEVFNEINKKFLKIPSSHKSFKQRTHDKQNKPQDLIEFKKTDQSHFVLGLRSYSLFSKYNPGLAVLADLLGGGMSSRLFQILREELGVCYYVHSNNEAFTDHGYLGISAGVDNKRIEEVIKVILIECQRLKVESVSEEELKKVKEHLIGNLKLSLESSDEIALFYGIQELLRNKIYSIEEKINKIYKVSSKEIKYLANDIFKNNNLNLAIVGPFDKKEKNRFLKILKI